MTPSGRPSSTTCWFVIIVVPLQTALALWLATLVNQKLRGVTVYRAIFFTPVVVIMAVAATVWLLLYSPDRGLANAFLGFGLFGAIESEFLDSTTWALPSIMFMSIWQGVGFQMIIILAGLQEIPDELYEASSIDGATRWEQFRYVTLPMLRNTLIFVVTVTTILAFRLFDQVWVMTRGEPLGQHQHDDARDGPGGLRAPADRPRLGHRRDLLPHRPDRHARAADPSQGGAILMATTEVGPPKRAPLVKAKWPKYLLLTLLAVFFLFPVMFMVVGAFKPDSRVLQ